VGSPQTLAVHGTGFTTLQSASVGGFPNNLVAVKGDSLLQMPLGNPVGSATAATVKVELVTGVGVTSVDVPLLPPPAPLLVTNTAAFSKTSSPAEVWRGAGSGDLTFLLFSLVASPTSIPGIVELGIGGQFTSLFDLGSAVMPSAGWSLDSLPIGSLPLGLPVNLQLAVLPLGAGLPLITSHVLSGSISF
jgi:hypothetical protein